MRFFIKIFFTIVPRNETVFTRSFQNNTGKYRFCSFSELQKQEESSKRTTLHLKEPLIPSNLPPKPRKPASSFILFVMSMKPTILRDNPTLTERELRKYAAKLWRDADTKTKEQYQVKYYTKLENYYEYMTEYKSSLTEKQIIAEKSFKVRKKEYRIRKAVEKEMKELAKPKRPLNSFALYMVSRKNEFKNNKASGYWHHLIKDWYELPERKKNVFRRKSKKLQKEYYEKLAEWKAQPLNITHIIEEKKCLKKKLNEESKKSSTEFVED